MQPLEMYFDNSQFTKICKIQTKCYVTETVKVIRKLKPKVNWFTEHPQFHHFFHMLEEQNLELMEMWMLLLRTIRIEEEDISWFGVNEHALISGLDCHEYPSRHLKLGSYKFVDAYFSNREKITIEDVKHILLAMKPCSDRLKMAVLFFLSRIIRGKPKDSGPLDQFILRIVDKLDGRLTFEEAIKGIKHMMNLLKGEPHPTTSFAGFIIPLEGKTIWWEEMYELDIAARKFSKKKDNGKGKNVEALSSKTDLKSILKGLEVRIVKSMEAGFDGLKKNVETKLESMDRRLSGMEKTQQYLKRKAKKLERRLTSLESKGNKDMNRNDYMEFDQWEMNYDREECDKDTESVARDSEEEAEKGKIMILLKRLRKKRRTRIGEPSQWVLSPFTEGKTDELEEP
ncbi:hypothetical protein N665_0267s0001 [Sinapis alba]|nr:hypothetical protein N665_0267s0001 [Sinapis alba]